ncbi:MAG TPA: ABC transporter substrate-binding protein [Burkholderiales bacterium]|nr:ABC transporter substrate-binding protein [Burkholderiales bacterium]
MKNKRSLVLLSFLFSLFAAPAHALDKVVFLTNWYAEAEHGGFYQALAEGIYRRHGLDVTVKMGGPQVNVMQLLLAEQADMVMGYDIQTLQAIEQNLPVVTVGAVFQSDPVALIAHPDVERIEDLKTRTLLIGQASETTYWPWLKAKFGFTDQQKRPYAFSVQQFLVDKNVAQQGYATSEPYSIEKGGVKPKVFLLAQYGYPPYAETIIALDKTVRTRADVVHRFYQATAEGWKSYLKNPAPGNALIRKANPQMSDDVLAYGVASIKKFALVDGGDARTLGILAMTDARWKQTYDFMVGAGMLNKDTDWKKAYTLQFVRQVKVLP